MKETVRTYEAEDIIVRYDVVRCIHARECVRGLPSVFDPAARPSNTGQPLLSEDDFRADAAVGENLQEERVFEASVDDVDFRRRALYRAAALGPQARRRIGGDHRSRRRRDPLRCGAARP